MRQVPSMLLRVCRIASLLLLSSLGVVVLMRAAPGYFDDERELNAEHANTTRAQLQAQQPTALQMWSTLTWGVLHGDFGTSRQYDTPVWPLIKPRLQTTARTLLPAVTLGSLVALCAAMIGVLTRGPTAYRGMNAFAAAASAIPVSVIALYCLLSSCGGAAAVLFVLIVGRDLRLFSRLLRRHAAAPHLLFARAAGVGPWRLALRHLLWPMRHEIAALLLTSFLVGLNAVLPVEVIFGVPGIGQLAWTAAMNRDLPVLLAISLLLAACVGIAGIFHRRQIHGVTA